MASECRRIRTLSFALATSLAPLAGACSGNTSPGTVVETPGAPVGWLSASPTPYELGTVRGLAHSGRRAAYIRNPSGSVGAASSFATMSQSIRADAYRGKRIRWSAWVKHENLSSTDAGVWLRIDGPGVTDAFDNMSSRSLEGTADWHQVFVVLDVPQHAIGISLGVLVQGTGVLYVDDLTLEAVGADVPTTALQLNQPSAVDSATLVATYSRGRDTPQDLDFESAAIDGPSSATVSWLSKNAVQLATTDPNASLDDLAPIGEMIGGAHLVGLGEGTHGTREFFQMKHRILEYLVQHDGFTHFAIEATSPESENVNRYVLSGQGNPASLLSNLYFWTWNTQEVLDMIRWMRQWNSAAPPAQRVTFQGFDMQSPGAAMDSVVAFVTRVDSAQSPVVAQRFACLSAYRNHGSVAGANPVAYAAAAASAKAACAAGLQDVYELLNGHAAAYTAASSTAEFAGVLHDARLVQEYETMIEATGTASSLARDRAMAENIEWLRAQYGSDAKLVLWAHNGHINSIPGYMGGYLRDRYGSDYVNLGFLFGTGSFNSVGPNGLTAYQATQIPPNSIEAVFGGTKQPELLFDARKIASGGASAAPMAGPIPMRSIGAVYQPASELAYFSNAFLPSDFDLLVYIAHAHQSTLLPFAF